MRNSMRLATAAVVLTAWAARASVDSPHENMPLDCEACHTTSSFKNVEYDHTHTDFELEGRHAMENCLSCHDVRDFSKAQSQCASCHTDVHESKLGIDCARCHTSSSWSVFDVNEIHLSTSAPVMGRHAMIDCQSCHPSLPQGDIASNTARCVDCHQTDYLEVASPNHVSGSFSTECQDCHQMNFWRPAGLADHESFFPIFSGKHAGEWPECATCHTNPSNHQVFTCLTCHDHAQTDMDPKHAGMPGYAYESNACYSCHPSGTKAPFVEHDPQFFPIYSGKHVSTWADCSECHDNPTNRALFTCISCHEHTQPLMDPAHSGFPGYAWESNSCLSCHPTGDAGQFAEHDATFFPIYSGTHIGEWNNDCTSCHPDPQQRAAFNCVSCHAHTQPLTDPLHNGMPGYAWESNACLSCHPTGLAGQFLDHDIQFFPIYSGSHSGAWNDCATCHDNPANRAQFTCLTCHEHTQPLMDPVHNGIPGYAWESNSCLSCHPAGLAGQFTEHDPLFFPIFSGIHNGKWNNDCTTCHPNPQQRSLVDCLGCHEHSAEKMNDKHSGEQGYTYTTDACLTCHPDGRN